MVRELTGLLVSLLGPIFFRLTAADGIPTVVTVKRLGIDFEEVLEVLKANGVQ